MPACSPLSPLSWTTPPPPDLPPPAAPGRCARDALGPGSAAQTVRQGPLGSSASAPPVHRGNPLPGPLHLVHPGMPPGSLGAQLLRPGVHQ